MQFIDHTGHIFSMPSYNNKPIGYEFEETDYVFWMNTEYSWKLSVDTYYMKPIRALVPVYPGNIEITVDSKKFGLLGSNIFENLSPDNSITINEDVIKQKLELNDIVAVPNLTIDEHSENWTLITFYVVSNSDEPGVWETNVLLHINNDWCPITVGADVVDECEELIINGRNLGINLPKDILKAMYQTNINDAIADESLYAQKMKELLVNYMLIKGEAWSTQLDFLE